LTSAVGTSLGANSEGMKADIVAAIPSLRAFAVSLSGNPDRADDLVHDTLLKALGSMDSFTEGTNLIAWLFTILRNAYYSEYRKRRRETADPDGALAARLEAPAAQPGHMDLLDFREALQKLPADQREALILIGASGLSYDEAAEICNCAPGTMKSRVNRARNRLSELLGLEESQRLETEDATAKPKTRRAAESVASRR
jgi:RNA polymerase sigma-70 factor (ECF subfamily)